MARVCDDHGEERRGGCCGACLKGASGRPLFVAGVFADLAGARAVADRLRLRDAGIVSVLSTVAHGLPELQITAVMALSHCTRLSQQIARHLDSGAAVVIVDTDTRERQLGASRALLESKCEVLLTHDGRAHAD